MGRKKQFLKRDIPNGKKLYQLQCWGTSKTNRELGKCQMTATVTVGICSAHTSIFLVPIRLSPSLLQQNCIPSYTIGRRRKKKMKAGQTSTPQGFLKDLLLFSLCIISTCSICCNDVCWYCRRTTNTNLCTLCNILFLKKKNFWRRSIAPEVIM